MDENLEEECDDCREKHKELEDGVVMEQSEAVSGLEVDWRIVSKIDLGSQQESSEQKIETSSVQMDFEESLKRIRILEKELQGDIENNCCSKKLLANLAAKSEKSGDI
jgi:hypothetical protein